jgi:cytochrome c5
LKKAIFVALAVMAAALTTGPVAAADGKAVYEKTCKGCHLAMPPKFGDKAAWAPFLSKGAKEMTAVVMKGKKPMPPKGGAANEEDVAAAVQYIIDSHK